MEIVKLEPILMEQFLCFKATKIYRFLIPHYSFFSSVPEFSNFSFLF